MPMISQMLARLIALYTNTIGKIELVICGCVPTFVEWLKAKTKAAICLPYSSRYVRAPAMRIRRFFFSFIDISKVIPNRVRCDNDIRLDRPAIFDFIDIQNQNKLNRDEKKIVVSFLFVDVVVGLGPICCPANELYRSANAVVCKSRRPLRKKLLHCRRTIIINRFTTIYLCVCNVYK